MSSYQIMKCLRKWTHDPVARERAQQSSAAELVAEHDLTAEEAEAIIGGRLDWLLARDVHPMSLVQLSRIFGFPITERWQELHAAGKRTS